MPTSDGSVEIRITGSVDPSVAAAANEAKASVGGLEASVSNIRPGFDATSAQLKQLITQTGSFAAAQKALTAANGNMVEALAATTAGEIAVNAATKASTASAINSRSVYEGLALVHEAMAGRYTRMASTSLIFGQAVAGQSAVMKAAQFATSGYGLAIIGTVAALALVTAASISYENEEKKLIATSVGLGAQSGLTAKQLRDIGESANSATQSVRETTKAAEDFAAAGLSNEQTVKALSNSVDAYSKLTGVKFAEAQKTLAAAMKDPVKGAKDLHEQLGILSGDQIEQIERLTALGEKDQAAAIITQELTHRLDEAKTAGVGLQGEFGDLINVLSNVYNWIGNVTEGFGKEAETLLEDLIPALYQTAQAHRDAAGAAAQQAQNESALNKITGKGADLWATTPEGQSVKQRLELQGNVNAAKDAYTVMKATLGENAIATQRAKQTLEDYTHALNTYLTPVEKKLKADQLDVQIATAKHSHNKQLVADLVEQKTLLQEAGKVESDADARALAAGQGSVAGARTFGPKGAKGPSIVSEWAEELHQAEILSNNFFDDETTTELKFWQSKLGQVKTGSKEWLEVQSHVYEAQKALAHRDYSEHLADINDRLEADRSDYAKFKADWAEKLTFIKSKFKEESTEYKDAHRQMVSEDRQFQDRLIQEELTGNNRMIAALRKSLQDQQQIRNEYAKMKESVLQDNAGTSPFGDISALVKIGQMHHQLAMDEIKDAQLVFNQENALRAKGVADALAAYGKDDQRYKIAVQDKLNAEKQFHDQLRTMQLKALNQQLQDIQRVKQAYHQYIDGTVSSTVSGFANMLDGTGTWRDAMIGIYNSIKSAAEQVISQIISNWIVNLLVGKAAQSTTAAAQVASYAGVAGAAGVASWAAAPWPIDAGAPAFGASMAAAAAAFAPLASLDKGTNYLPSDMLVQAHQGERVVPKADNQKLIQLVSSAANSNSPSDPDVHLHFHGDVIGSRSAMEQWARQNRHMFGAGAKAFVRYGGGLDPGRR